jgi:hypothetical protein
MPEKKLLARLSAYLNLSAKRRKKKADELKAVIAKIKHKEKALLAEIDNAGKGKNRELLKKRYRILHAQRQKGLKVLKNIS